MERLPTRAMGERQISLLMASNPPLEGMFLPQPTDYPAQAKHAAGLVDGQLTDVMTLYFSDNIMVTITQGGRLAQWVSLCSVCNRPRVLTTITDASFSWLGNIWDG